MDKDFEIELQDESVEEANGTQLPMNFLTFGEIESDDVKVYIKQDVYKALEKLAASDTSKELGSILLGEYTEEHGKTHVIISGYIEAKYTDASASTLTFTHETWDYVHTTHEKKHPDKKIVGWQHTHPNYGIFLSNYDMFIQENFFNLPFQIAYVIDPIQNLRGFFQWKNGKIEKLHGYYIYDEVGKPVKIEQIKVDKSERKGKASRLATVFIALLCAATVVLSGVCVSMYQKNKELLLKESHMANELIDKDKKIEDQQSELDSKDVIIDDQADAITQMQGLLSDGILDSSGQTTANDLIDILRSKDLGLPDRDKIIGELEALIARVPDGDNVTFKAYTVAAGDSLSKICADNGIDYASNVGVIMAINGLTDLDQIYVDQTLLLPMAD